MSDITFEQEDMAFQDFLDSLPPTGAVEIEVNQAEIDALIAELAKEFPTSVDLDTTSPEIDMQELEAWLDTLDPNTPDMDF